MSPEGFDIGFSGESLNNIDGLAKYMGLESRVEVVRDALVLYQWMCDAYQQGGNMKVFVGGEPIDVMQGLKEGRKRHYGENIIRIIDHIPTERPEPPKPKESA